MFLTEHTKGRKSASLPANHKTLVIQHQRRSFFFIISALTFDFLLLFGLQTHALHFDCCYTDYYWGFTATMSVLVEYIYTLNVTKDIPDTEKNTLNIFTSATKGGNISLPFSLNGTDELSIHRRDKVGRSV